MKLMIFIIKTEDKIDRFIQKLDIHEIKNITILNGNCVAHDNIGRNRNKNVKIFSSIRYIMDYFYDDSKVVVFPIEEEKIKEVEQSTTDILNKGDFVFFVVPLDRIEGNL